MAESRHALADLLQDDHWECLWFRDISDNIMSLGERMLTQRLALGFPIVVCTTTVDALAAARTIRNYLQATSQGDLGDLEISLPLVFQGAPGRNDGISA